MMTAGVLTIAVSFAMMAVLSNRKGRVMEQAFDPKDAKSIASEIAAEIRALPVQNTANRRAVRRKYSQRLRQVAPDFVLDVAKELFRNHRQRGWACELIKNHKAAFKHIGEVELEEFGQGINSWGSVDTFARILAGPAWLSGQVSDEVIYKWAHSEDQWW
ncbi:MAG: DNA alkylation repair protein, partial [Dehalococcoidales bacterium]